MALKKPLVNYGYRPLEILVTDIMDATSSVALNSISASYAPGSPSISSSYSLSSSYADSAKSSSYAETALSASYAPGSPTVSSSYSLSSSYSDTAKSSSYAPGQPTSSYSLQNLTSSYSETNKSSSYSLSSSYADSANSSSYAPGQPTSSYALAGLTSSYSETNKSSSYAISSSFSNTSTTSSYSTYEFILNRRPAANLTAEGIKTFFLASGAQNFGDVIFINNTGSAQMGNATTIATSGCIGMCMISASHNVTGSYLLQGIARHDGWSWTPGIVYLSTTGDSGTTLTQAPQSGSSKVVQVIGIAIAATLLYFNPQLVMVETQ